MSTQDHSPYHGLTPEELHVIVRRAHAERAAVMRALFARLLEWRRHASDGPHPAVPKAAACS